MANEAVLRKTTTQYLVDKFGIIETERFISSIKKDPMDYTQWRKKLYESMSAEEVSAKAMAYQKQLTE